MSHGDWKAFFLAIQNNNIDLVQYYLRIGVDVNYQHPEYFTSPLIESIRKKHIEITKCLLKHNANPKLKECYSNRSPIEFAIENRDKETISILNKYLNQLN